MRGTTSPLFTQEREVNPFSDSVHQQVAGSAAATQEQPASFMSRMMGVAGNCNVVLMLLGVAGKLQRSDCSDVERSQCVVPRTRKILSERENIHDYLEREALRALQGGRIAQRQLSEAEMERDEIYGTKEILTGRLCMEPTFNLNHKRQSFHHANQWACEAQMESRRMFEELMTKSRFYQVNHALDCMEILELQKFVVKKRKELDS